jgi:hypothetical protein
MGAFTQFKGLKLGYLATKCNVIRRELKNLEKAFVRWNAEEQGGQLTKKVATRVAEHIKSGLLDESIFDPGRAEKNKDWVKRLRLLNAPRPDALGLGATFTLVEAIDAFPSGRGGYAVGIRTRAKMPLEVTDIEGNVVRYAKEGTTVQDVAYWLEFGSETQPPRPWFSRGFMEYMEDKLPDDIRRTIYKDIVRALRKAAAAANAEKNLPDYQPEDLYRGYVGEMPAGVDLSRRGVTETLGYGYEAEEEW